MQTCLIKTKEFYVTHVTENSRRVIPQSGSNTAHNSLAHNSLPIKTLAYNSLSSALLPVGLVTSGMPPQWKNIARGSWKDICV